MLKSDLHIHTNLDPVDSYIKHSPQDLINYASKFNFQVLSITHHKQLYYNKEIADYAKKKGILLIPGVELCINGKDILAYNLTKEQSSKIKDFRDLEKLKEQDNIVITAPHPFYKIKKCLGPLLLQYINLFDAIEFSRLYIKVLNPNKEAIMVAKKFNKTIIGGSDTHQLNHLNTTYSLIDSEQEIDSVLEAIRKDKVEIRTSPTPLLNFLKESSGSLYWQITQSF